MDYYFHFIVSQALIAIKLSQLLSVILFHINWVCRKLWKWISY